MVNMRIFCTGRTLQNTFLIHMTVNAAARQSWFCDKTSSNLVHRAASDNIYSLFFFGSTKVLGVKPDQLWSRNCGRKYDSLACVHKFKVVWVVVRHVRWDGVASGHIPASKTIVGHPLSEVGRKICETSWGRLLRKGGLTPGKWRSEGVSDIRAC